MCSREVEAAEKEVGEGNKRRKDEEMSSSMEQETPQLQGRSFPYASLFFTLHNRFSLMECSSL